VIEGQESAFTVDAWPDRRFKAKVEQVRFGAQTLEGVVTYETVLEVDNAERLLRPGMTATAEITVKQVKDAVLIPNAALRFTPPARAEQPSGGILSALIPMRRFGAGKPQDNGKKQSRVYTLANGHAEPVDVTVGPSDGTWTELRKGDVAPDTPLVVDASSAKK
jgi:HlyD family secretion protein